MKATLSALLFCWLLPQGAHSQSASVTGSPQVVVDWTTQTTCTADPYYFSDCPTTAFRDADDDIHLRWGHGSKLCALDGDGIGAAYEMVGSTFGGLQLQCTPTMLASFKADHTLRNDHEWLQSFWSPDGIRVHGLIHHEYHVECHFPSLCSAIPADVCNPRAITAAFSLDSGLTFRQITPPGQMVATAPHLWSPGDSPVGSCEQPTNILESGGWYYCMFTFANFKLEGGELKPGDERQGLMRTQHLSDPTSWRAWGGSLAGGGSGAFDVSFVDPYVNPPANPNEHLPRQVDFQGDVLFTVFGHYWSTYLEKFVAVGRSFDFGSGLTGVFLSYSDDQVTWTLPELLDSSLLGDSILYPTIIDHDSTRRNFDHIGDTAYVYWVETDFYDRQLMRVPIQFSTP